MSRSLKADLDAYADEHKLSVSRVVTQALQAFLPGQTPTDPDLVNTQRYIGQLVEQLEGLRQSVHRMTLAQYGPFAALPENVTTPLPRPPWPRRELDELGDEDDEDPA